MSASKMAMASQMLAMAATTLQPNPKTTKQRRTAGSDDDDGKESSRGDAGREPSSDGGEQSAKRPKEPLEGKFFNGTLSRWHNRYSKLPIEFIMEVLNEKNPQRYTSKAMLQHQQPGSEKHREDLSGIMIKECRIDGKQPISRLLRDRPKLLLSILLGREAGSDDEGNIFGSSGASSSAGPAVVAGFAAAPPNDSHPVNFKVEEPSAPRSVIARRSLKPRAC
jgi:hypothetical protein